MSELMTYEKFSISVYHILLNNMLILIEYDLGTDFSYYKDHSRLHEQVLDAS